MTLCLCKYHYIKVIKTAVSYNLTVHALDDFESSYIETQTICLAFRATALSDDSLIGVGRFTVALLGMILNILFKTFLASLIFKLESV